MHTLLAENPEAYLRIFGISGMVSQGADGKPIVHEKMHPVLLEISPR